MKQYRQLVTELPAKKVVFAFGRFQPPTTGHELLVNAVKKIASAQKADHIIFASRTHDKKSNPLPVDRKVYYLKRMFPGANFIAANEEIRTFMEAAKALSKKYKNLIMVAGSDRVPEYKKLLDRYNGKDFKFDTVEVVSAGERDPDADTASGMSGTKMREAAKKNDFQLFKRGLPHTLTELDGKRLMNEIRQGMGLEVVKEHVKFETDELREKYFAGEIFHEGEIVESSGVVYQIIKRGSNHLLLQDEAGNKVTKWIQDVETTDKEFNQQGLQEMKFNSTDKIKVARIIAASLGDENVDEKSGAENMVNTALRKVKNKALSKEAWKIICHMLDLADDAGVKYDKNILASKLQSVEEATVTKEIETLEQPQDNQSDKDAEENKPVVDTSKVGHSLAAPNDQLRRMKIKHLLGEEKDEDIDDEFSDKEIEKMIDKLSDDELLEAYEDSDFVLEDEESGEIVEELQTEEVINEVLSRAERLRAKARFHRSAAKRERKIKIALKSHSSQDVINARARRLAIKMMKTKLARKPLSQLSTSEKERIESIVARRKKVLNRIAMKLVPRIKKVESQRLTGKHTK